MVLALLTQILISPSLLHDLNLTLLPILWFRRLYHRSVFYIIAQDCDFVILTTPSSFNIIVSCLWSRCLYCSFWFHHHRPNMWLLILPQILISLSCSLFLILIFSPQQWILLFFPLPAGARVFFCASGGQGSVRELCWRKVPCATTAAPAPAPWQRGALLPQPFGRGTQGTAPVLRAKEAGGTWSRLCPTASRCYDLRCGKYRQPGQFSPPKEMLNCF